MVKRHRTSADDPRRARRAGLDEALLARLAVLEARVAALEGSPAVEPPFALPPVAERHERPIGDVLKPRAVGVIRAVLGPSWEPPRSR